MKTEQFTKLIQLATGRNFQIATTDEELRNENEYYVFRTLPVTGRKISFKWTNAQDR